MRPSRFPPEPACHNPPPLTAPAMENSLPLNVEAPGIPVRPLESSLRQGRIGAIAFGAALLAGLLYVGANLIRDLGQVHAPSVLPYLLLVLALVVALGFEFVNGFHDTANAVATVIYTHSLPAQIAVVWSGASISLAFCCRAAPSHSA